ncbi:MAG: hypothetical protein PHR35_00270 [Kiritimatiellae bacterium]|nr:hypothetical protein [Kiritimatiellia bacterium]
MDWNKFVSQYDLIYETPPTDWPDGFLLGNGSLGAVYYAPDALCWLINKADVLDNRVTEVKRIMTPDEAVRMIREGADSQTLNHEEYGTPPPSGVGPKSCGRLTIDLGAGRASGWHGALPAIRSRLGLYDATLHVEVDKHLYHPRVTSFVRAEEDMLVIRVRDVSPMVNPITTIYFSRPEDIQLAEPELTVERGRLLLTMPSMPEAYPYVTAIAVIPRPSKTYRDTFLPRIREKYRAPELGTADLRMQGKLGIIRVSGDFDLLLTVATARDNPDPRDEVHRRLDRATATGLEPLHETHADWWAEYWRRSWVELGDKAQEQLFYLSLYALGSTYRRGPMPGILGLVYGPWLGNVQTSPWGGGLANDLNIQCPFFPVHALNHSELFEAYLDTSDLLLPESRRLARAVFGARGAHVASYTILGNMSSGLGAVHFLYMGSYQALMHCLCWRYRRDVKQLRERLYPFLKEILAFYLDMLRKGQDGRYHLWPSYAVELEIMDCGDAVQIMSMLKVCLQTAVEAAELMGVDDAEAAQWKEILAHFPDYAQGTDQQGRRVVVDGDGIPADHHVGQAGCLHPVYPCGEVDEFAAPDTLALYQRTLDSVLDKTAETVYAAEHGFFYESAWACFFRAMTALRLGRAEDFWRLHLPRLLKAHAKPNGLMSHDATYLVDPADSEANLANIPDRCLDDVGEKMPLFEPWCGHFGCSTPNARAKQLIEPLIEVNGDYLTMMTETMLQSHNGVIRVFPAWPKEREAQFANWVAEGGTIVSARHTGGQVAFITLRRGAGAAALRRAHVRSPWTGEVLACDLPAEGAITLTAVGVRAGAEAQEPQPPESARPRVLVPHPRYPLWLGRPDFTVPASN